MKLKEKLDEKVYEILLELVEEACIPEGISTEKACKKITELITHTYTPAILEEFANHLDNHALFKYSKCPLAIKQIEEFITTLQEELDEYTKKT